MVLLVNDVRKRLTCVSRLSVRMEYASTNFSDTNAFVDLALREICVKSILTTAEEVQRISPIQPTLVKMVGSALTKLMIIHVFVKLDSPEKAVSIQLTIVHQSHVGILQHVKTHIWILNANVVQDLEDAFVNLTTMNVQSTHVIQQEQLNAMTLTTNLNVNVEMDIRENSARQM